MIKSIRNNKLVIYILLFTTVFILVNIGLVVYYRGSIFKILAEAEKGSHIGKHYAFICENSQDEFYKAIFEGASKEAEAEEDYLENMGGNLVVTHDKFELMELSIDAGVDGIIVNAGESETMKELIDRADSEGIPVITVGSDNTSSARRSYVGYGYYDLGINYGKEILKKATDEEKEVLILMSPDAEDSSQNIIFQGIKETIERADASGSFHLATMAVPDTSAFGAEESISALIMREEKLPDMIICLNEIYTTCVCQALVDYNRVGDSLVYGFYENSTILSAIRKNIIYATVTMNTDQMGRFCIEALREYEESGYVNEYMPADIRVVTADNIDDYLREKSEDEDEKAL